MCADVTHPPPTRQDVATWWDVRRLYLEEYLPTAYLQTTWSTLVGVAYLLQVGHNICVRTEFSVKAV
jgi:hypothetical protein